MTHGIKRSPQPAIATFVLIVASQLLLGSCAVSPTDPGTAYGNQLGATQYLVKPGDNLVLIAADITRQRENWRRIADFNRIDNPASLRVGQTIWIPNDLIPLGSNQKDTRSIAGHPDAVVNSVKLPTGIKPVN